MPFRSLLLICSLAFISIITTGCSATFNQVSANSPLPGPQLSQQIAAQTVALVSDDGSPGDIHGTFCSAVWVGQRTLLTANHCLEGYAKHLHQMQQLQALIKYGVPEDAAEIALSLGLEELDSDDPTMPDEIKQMLQIISQVPPVSPDTLHIAYIVQSEVIDIGVAPRALHQAQVVARTPHKDLALLQAYGFIPPHAVAPLADTSPLVGAQVEVMGTPYYNFWLYRQGVVGAYRHSLQHDGMTEIDGPFLQASILITNGDSGGGLFDDRGHLVGIISFMNKGEPALGGFAIPLDTLRGFMAGQHLVPLKLSPSTKDPVLDDEKLPEIQ